MLGTMCGTNQNAGLWIPVLADTSIENLLHQCSGIIAEDREEDCRSQRIKEFAVGLCLLQVSELILMKSQ